MAKELLIGAHTSIAGGVYNALLQGKEIGATTIQMFTANQRQWAGKPLVQEDIDKWHATLKETGLKEIMSHDSYLINLGSCDSEILQKSRKTFRQEVERCLQLGITYLNFHPGAATDGNVERCMDCICESVLELEPLVSKTSLRLLLEATAGQGSSIGYRFEELAYMLKKLEKRIPIGVCIDTCHIFAAGYDIRTPEAWNATLKEFDRVAGLKHLYAFHLNDSVKPLGSRVDRHAQLGQGEIGLESFKFLMKDPRTSKLPKYLETPDHTKWPAEISMLRGFA